MDAHPEFARRGCSALCWLLVISVGQNWPVSTPHPVFPSLLIPEKKSTIVSIDSLIFTRGMDTVQRILTFIT